MLLRSPSALHLSRLEEPLALTFGDLMREVALAERWFQEIQGHVSRSGDDISRYNSLCALNNRDLAVYKSRLEASPGIVDLYQCLIAIGEMAVTLPSLARLRVVVTGGNPFDTSLDALTIPEVVARLRQIAVPPQLSIESSPASSQAPPVDPELKPASWFPPDVRKRLRRAAARGTKRVHVEIVDGVPLYSAADARRWWPEDFEGKR